MEKGNALYQCCMCKFVFQGEAHYKNGVGSFCEPCRNEMKDRQATAVKAKIESWDGNCIWCGEPANRARRSNSETNERVCRYCETARERVLKMVRFGDRMAKYVARIENREAPERKKREDFERFNQQLREEIESKVINNIDSRQRNAELVPEIHEDRIRRMENMMATLMKSLGVDPS